MIRKSLEDLIKEHEGEELLLADGFDNAIMGISCGMNPVVVYSYNKCIEILMERDEMEEEDAIEYMEFNVVGAYVGEKTPIFFHDYEGEY